MWVNDDPTVPPLAEEHIVMWERMFIKNNEKLLSWHEREQAAAIQGGGSAGVKKRLSLGEFLKMTFKQATGPAVQPRAVQLASVDIPTDFGYHDFVL